MSMVSPDDRRSAPPGLDPKSKVGPPLGVVRELDVDGSLTIYRRDIDRVLVLNATASDVWRLCDGTLSEADIVDRLARVYDVAAATIADDVRSTVVEFLTEEFIALTVR